MPTPFNTLAKQIDELIRSGKGAVARKLLEETEGKKLPRELSARFAALAWRANLPELGVRILNPLIRTERRRPAIATDEEKAEYAQCLSNVHLAAWRLHSRQSERTRVRKRLVA